MCSLKIPSISPIKLKRSKLEISIPYKCKKVNIMVGNEYFMLSGFAVIINKILDEIPNEYKIIIHITNETPEIISSYLYGRIDSDRIEIYKAT